MTTIKLESLSVELWNYHNKFSRYWQNNSFRRLFSIFHTKPEVDLSNLYHLLITAIKLINLPLKFLKCPNQFASYWRKTGFRWPFSIFHAKPEVDLSNLYFLLSTTIELLNLPFKFLECLNQVSSYWQTTSFWRLFCIFHMKPEVDLSNLYFLQITTIELENLPSKFL